MLLNHIHYAICQNRKGCEQPTFLRKSTSKAELLNPWHVKILFNLWFSGNFHASMISLSNLLLLTLLPLSVSVTTFPSILNNDLECDCLSLQYSVYPDGFLINQLFKEHALHIFSDVLILFVTLAELRSVYVSEIIFWFICELLCTQNGWKGH